RRALSLRRRARATRPDVGRSAPDPAPVARIEPLGPDRTLADRPIRPRRLRTRRQGSPAHQPADRTHAPGERRSVRLRWPGSRRCNRTERTPTRRSGRPGPDRAAATGPNAPRPVDPADLARIAPLQPDRTHPDPSIRPTWPGSRRCNRTERSPTRSRPRGSRRVVPPACPAGLPAALRPLGQLGDLGGEVREVLEALVDAGEPDGGDEVE